MAMSFAKMDLIGSIGIEAQSERTSFFRIWTNFAFKAALPPIA